MVHLQELIYFASGTVAQRVWEMESQKVAEEFRNRLTRFYQGEAYIRVSGSTGSEHIILSANSDQYHFQMMTLEQQMPIVEGIVLSVFNQEDSD